MISSGLFAINECADNAGPAHLTWAQSTEMVATDMRMEPHPRSHRDLKGRERALQVWTGSPAQILPWPAGRHDVLARQTAGPAGYLLAAGTCPGFLHSSGSCRGYGSAATMRDAYLLQGAWLAGARLNRAGFSCPESGPARP